jgi:type I restriction-modification system DNA methylase subunit
MKVNAEKIAYVESFIENTIATAVKSGNKTAIEKANTHKENFAAWVKATSTANLELPDVEMVKDSKGKIKLETEKVLSAIRKTCKIEDLQKFSSMEFAQMCIVKYGATNSTPNGFEQALRGFSEGWCFKWRPAVNEPGRTTAKATIATQHAKIAEQNAEIAEQKAIIAELERKLAEMQNGKKNK